MGKGLLDGELLGSRFLIVVWGIFFAVGSKI